jgi:hypothetical protein
MRPATLARIDEQGSTAQPFLTLTALVIKSRAAAGLAKIQSHTSYRFRHTPITLSPPFTGGLQRNTKHVFELVDETVNCAVPSAMVG